MKLLQNFSFVPRVPKQINNNVGFFIRCFIALLRTTRKSSSCSRYCAHCNPQFLFKNSFNFQFYILNRAEHRVLWSLSSMSSWRGRKYARGPYKWKEINEGGRKKIMHVKTERTRSCRIKLGWRSWMRWGGNSRLRSKQCHRSKKNTIEMKNPVVNRHSWHLTLQLLCNLDI